VSNPLVLREANPADLRLVWDSWPKSLVAALCRGRHTHSLERLLMRRGMLDLAQELVRRPGVRVTVAAYSELPSLLVGWACTESDVLHWVYVVRDYRRKGVCTYLVRGCKTMSLLTPTVAVVPALAALRWEPGRLLGELTA
jgi:hypothetical protein